MAQMVDIEVVDGWRAINHGQNHAVQWLRVRNASTLARTGMARGARRTRLDTTQLLPTFDAALQSTTGLSCSMQQIGHRCRQVVRRHCEHLIDFRTIDPHQKVPVWQGVRC